MPTHHPRVNCVLEPPLYQFVQLLAKRDAVSISMKVRDLIRDALELTEDLYWARKAGKRRTSYDPKKALTHDEVW